MRIMNRIFVFMKENPAEYCPFTVGRHVKMITNECASLPLRTQNLRSSLEISKNNFLLLTVFLPPIIFHHRLLNSPGLSFAIVKWPMSGITD